jgi:hypothetical protein
MAPGRMSARHRSGFVRFQQNLAREALFRGHLGAARVALRILRPDDFIGGDSVSASFLAVLRDARSSDDQVTRAIRVLIDLRVAGEK